MEAGLIEFLSWRIAQTMILVISTHNNSNTEDVLDTSYNQ